MNGFYYFLLGRAQSKGESKWILIFEYAINIEYLSNRTKFDMFSNGKSPTKNG